MGVWRTFACGVEWYCGRRGRERPARLRVGGATLEVAVDETWVEGPATAGGPVVRRFVVRDAEGQRYRISVVGDRSADVEAETPS